MKRGQRGFGVVVVLVILGVAAALGFIGWRVYQSKHQTPVASTAQSSTGTAATDRTPKAPGDLTVDSGKLPQGWSVENGDPGNVTLTDVATKCSINLYKSTNDTAKAADAVSDASQMSDATISGLKAKGYGVTRAPASTLTYTSSTGPQELPTLELGLTGPGTTFQSYAFIIKDGYTVQIQRNCNEQARLSTTAAAVLAVTVTE